MKTAYKSIIRNVLMSLLVFCLFIPTAIAANYSFITIDFPGAYHTYAYGINDAGQIVGYYLDYLDDAFGPYRPHGFLLSGGSFTTIDFPGVRNTEAHGINDAGQIVGGYTDTPGWPGYHGFLLSGGSFTTIDFPHVYYGTCALGINDAGQIVGSYFDGVSHYAFLLSGGSFTTIDFPGAYYTILR